MRKIIIENTKVAHRPIVSPGTPEQSSNAKNKRYKKKREWGGGGTAQGLLNVAPQLILF